MESGYDYDDILREFEKHYEEAREVLENQDKLEHFLERLEHKLGKVPIVGEKISGIPVLISLVRSYARKEYDNIPFASMAAIVVGLLYFLSPVDLFPDGIPGIGFVDDIFILGIVLDMINDDVDEYKAWQQENSIETVPQENE